MVNIIPAPLQPYAKAVIGLLGAIVTTLLISLPQPPHWLGIVSSVLTAIGVYVFPNTDPTEHEPATDGTPSATSLPEKPSGGS